MSIEDVADWYDLLAADDEANQELKQRGRP